jgi:hypothetical protein
MGVGGYCALDDVAGEELRLISDAIGAPYSTGNANPAIE